MLTCFQIVIIVTLAAGIQLRLFVEDKKKPINIIFQLTITKI